MAVDLARKHNHPEIEDLLRKYATKFLNKSDNKMEAVMLYRKANRYNEAARLLMQVAEEMNSRQKRTNMALLKKIYLLAALEVERKKENLSQGGTGSSSLANVKDSVDALGALMDVGTEDQLFENPCML